MYCDYGVSTSEGFTFSGEHTSGRKLILQDRVADPPSEKQILEDIPFMQGVLDFSAILGQRVYENRPLTFEFLIVDYSYERRKVIETSLTNWLMKPSHIELYDDFSRGYYYMAKCESIAYEDRYEGMSVIITFDAYPFMIGEYLEGNDLWDPFNFELDVAQTTKFTVRGSESITLYNAGSNMVPPKVIASAQFEIELGNRTFAIPQGVTESSEFTLGLGENKLTIRGNGTIEFQFRKELL